MSSKGLLGHNVVEILTRDLPAIRRGPLQHFLELLDIHGLSKFLGNSADVIGVDGASVIVVEKVEDLVDSVLSRHKCTRDYLSPSLEVIPSRNSSKSTSLPKD
jgi:hypothetical protein